MLVIVEGVDGVGKSSFCDRLARLIEKTHPDDTVGMLHAGPPNPKLDILEEYELLLQGYTPGTRTHVICDRWHVGEMVYGPLLRHHCRLDEARWRHLDMFLRAKGAITVHLTAPPRVVIERLKRKDGEELITEEQVEEVIHEYWDVLGTWFDVAHIHWGRDEENDARVVGATVKNAEWYEEAATKLGPFTTYVGSREPSILLLGEKRNPSGDGRWNAAFVPVPTNNSGHYLLRHLPLEMQRGVGMANALEEDIPALMKTLDFPSVVTLGREAHEVMGGYPHGSAPHPQYWRRFHHRQGETYRRLLREAALFGEELLTWRP
jgi:thymidylate kinase